MTGNGRAGRGRRDHQDAAGDRNLFHKQHPSTPPPRFSSPSRPRHPSPADDGFKALAYGAAVSTMLQGLVGVMLGALGISLYYGQLHEPDLEEDEKWRDWTTIMVNLYFKEDGTIPDLPEEGLLSPAQMQRFVFAATITNFLLLITSSDLIIRLWCNGKPKAILAMVVLWALSVMIATALDVVVAAAMVRDLVLLEGWDRWPGDYDVLRMCPGAILIVALRGGVLLLANVACMLLVLRRLYVQRQGSPRAATKTEGPLDGYLYGNGDRGVHNAAFVPDNAQPPYTTFRPEQDEQRDGDHRANGHSLNDLRGREDPEDIASHLMWMEEVDKHVDVQGRRGHAEGRPPQHHRHGFVEDRPPQYREHHHREHHHRDFVGEHFPSGSMRAAFGPLSPGPLPVGYPETGQGLRLPRTTRTAPPFQPPSLPPVDYSPPRTRAHGAHLMDRALAAGRAGLRPVRQDRGHDRGYDRGFDRGHDRGQDYY